MWYLQENNCGGVCFLIKLQTFKPATLLKRDSSAGVFPSNLQNLWENLFKRPPLVAASVAETDKKKQKDRYSIFVETQCHKETELIIKFNKYVFWIWNFIIPKLWKTKLEKRSLCAFIY